MTPLFTNDAVVLAILLGILATVFVTSHSERPVFKAFYRYIPAILLCYFIPSLFNSAGIISGDASQLYYIASRYLLPASLVLLTISIDIKGILNLGPKALIMFLAGTIGIVLGGPLAMLIVGTISPETVGGEGPDAVWRGLSTIAGSWIGGGANQTAMKEVWGVSDNLFSAMITVDVVVANIWMAFLLYGAGNSKKVDQWFKADSSAITELQERIEAYKASITKVPSLTDLMSIVAVGFGITGLSHMLTDLIVPALKVQAEFHPWITDFSLDSSFFWIVVLATTGGLILSFTRTRSLEGAGASKVGSLLLYILVATIGMKMNILAIFDNPGLFAVGLIWMLMHVSIMLGVGKLIKAPFFFVAVGSQANVGGAASAPVVASAFHPALAPVGVLLAVLGYALGTYGAYIAALLMRAVGGGG
jgi:uncharacterized membrane protein